jgi:uncharacterized protein YebE (UPF0316 family)
MEGELLVAGGYYTWLAIPLLIFLARVADVSMGTVRVIFVSRGFKYLAPIVGFFEIIIWLLAIGQIMKNLSNPACYLAYAGGFAIGNFVGIHIAEKLSLGVVLLRIVTRQDATRLVESLQSSNYGVTSIDGEGSSGPVKVVFTVIPRREVAGVVGIVREFNPRAFYSVEEVGMVERGIFPVKRTGLYSNFPGIFRPFRKGK